MCNPCSTNLSYICLAERVVTRWGSGIKIVNIGCGINGESRSLLVGVNDICKDGCLLKMILKDGEEWENPKDPDFVLGIHVHVSNLFNILLDNFAI